jgi:hypothetical protein
MEVTALARLLELESKETAQLPLKQEEQEGQGLV